MCGIGPITHYDPAVQKVKLAAEVKGFDPEALLGRQESKRMGRFTQFAVAAAREALSDAGFSVEQADADRCGVILSSGIGGQAITEAEHSRGLEKGFDRVSPFYVPTAICNMAAGQVAIDAASGPCAPAPSPPAPEAPTPWATPSTTFGTATPRSCSAAAPRPPSRPCPSAASPP